MLELNDIQHLLLTRAPALTARYEFLSFRDGAGGRAWVSAIKEKVHSAASMRDSVDQDKRWVTAAFTWNGLRALGLDEASLTSFPEEFKQGMAARAEMLGDLGRMRRSIGWADLRAPTFTQSSFSSRGMMQNTIASSRSTKSSSPVAPASKCCPCSTFTPFRHSATRTSTSAIATGCRSRPPRETASYRRRELARL